MLTKAPLPARALVLVLLLVLLVAAGCSKPTAPATAVPPNFAPISHNGAGITIAVPSDWVQIPMPNNQNVARFNETALPLVEQNPRLLPAVASARQVLQNGGKAFAVSPDGQMRANVTVDKADADTLDELAAKVVPQLEGSGAKDLAQERATTGAGPAVKLRYRFPIDAGGNETVLADEEQYFVLHDGKSYVLTVINGQGGIADKIAETLRLR